MGQTGTRSGGKRQLEARWRQQGLDGIGELGQDGWVGHWGGIPYMGWDTRQGWVPVRGGVPVMGWDTRHRWGSRQG